LCETNGYSVLTGRMWARSVQRGSMRPKSFLLRVLLFVISLSLSAQTAGTGAIAGTVSDSSGAVIPNATVQATSTSTGQQRTVVTAADGTYKFALLQPGAYQIRFSANGFKTVEVPSITVNVTETPVLDRSLEVGTQTEQVTVEANAEAIQTTSAALGGVLAGSEVTNLPLTTRNYTNILALSAGVGAGVTNASSLGKAGMSMAVNGSGVGSNNTLMDGASISNFAGPGDNATDFVVWGGQAVPNPDTIQEFKVQTSLYDAGYGRNSGANVSIITRSGTNAFHGTAFEFFRNTSLNANDFFLNLGGKGKGVLNQNQYGGTLGGPVKKDRLFFFGSFQGTRQKNGVARQGNSAVTLTPIPTGDRANTTQFQAALGASFCPANHPGDTRYNTFRGGVQVACDGTNINPVAVALLQAKLPDGSYFVKGSTNGTFQNVNFSIPAIYREDQIMLNGDYLVTGKHTLTARYFRGHNPTDLSFQSAGILPGTPTSFLGENTTALLKLTSVLTASLVNEARFSLQRNINNSDSGETFTDHQFGITPLNPQLDPPGFLARIAITNGPKLGVPTGNDITHAVSTAYQFADQISWTHGKHTVRAGFEYGRSRWNWNFPGLGVGNLLFSTFDDFLLGLPGCTPGDTTCAPTHPTLTNGQPNNGTAFSNIASTTQAAVLSAAGLPHAFRVNDASSFINDDIKLNPRLTLNLGLRWEYGGLLNDKYGNQTNFWTSAILSVPAPGSTPATGSLAGYVVPRSFQGVLPAGVIRGPRNDETPNGPGRNNYAPRFGFAWQPLGGNKFVVRGGYGWFFDRVSGSGLGLHLASPPYATRTDTSGTNNYFSTLAKPYVSLPYYTFPARWVDFATGQSSNLFQLGTTDDFNTPRVQSYNLSVQYQLRPSWVLEVAYVGSHGIHLFAQRGINGALLASAGTPINNVTTNTVTNVTLRVPYLGYGNGTNLGNWQTVFDQKFNSLQATLRKQMSHGLSFQAAYTWSKALIDTSLQSDPSNLKLNYGPSAAYRPQRLVLSYNWQLPFRNPAGLVGKLVAGWTLSGVTTIQNGTPLTVTSALGGSIFGLSTSTSQLCTGLTYADIATSGDLGSRLGGAAGGQGYFNKAAFCGLPTIGNGTGFGSMGIGVILGPGQLNFDTALIKSTKVGGIREAARLEFRAEFFNAFNHSQFDNPSLVSSAGTFGQITATAVNPRLVQLALKYVF